MNCCSGPTQVEAYNVEAYNASYSDAPSEHESNQEAGAAFAWTSSSVEDSQMEINRINEHQNQVLDCIINSDSINISRLLKNPEIKKHLNAYTNHGLTLLQHALNVEDHPTISESDKNTVILLLLSHGADPNVHSPNQDSPLKTAIRQNNYIAVTGLCSYGAEVSPDVLEESLAYAEQNEDTLIYDYLKHTLQAQKDSEGCNLL